MRLDIKSPLQACALPESGRLSAYAVFGILTELSINLDEYATLEVKELIGRAAPALETGQAKIFLDDDRHPYGYASWSLLSDDAHQSLLENPTSGAAHSTTFFHTQKGRHLWFHDVLSPFTSPLFMLRTLKQEIGGQDQAFLLHNLDAATARARRVW